MKIRQKMLLGASVITLLIAAAGGIGWYAKNQTLYLSNIRQAGNELLTLKVRERANLRHYLQAEGLEEMAELEERHHHIHQELAMWSAAMEYGTESVDFKSNELIYTLWQKKKEQAGGLNITIPHVPKIAKFMRDYTVADSEFQLLEERAMMIHNERLAADNNFDAVYPREKDLRYKIRDVVYSLGDHGLTKSLGLVLYFSKESLFQYRDKKHRDEWLSQIDQLRNEVSRYRAANGDSDALASLDADLSEYRELADTLGSLAIRARDLAAREKASLESFDIIISDFLLRWQVQYQSTVHSLTAREQSRVNIFLSAATIMGCIISLFAAFLLTGYFSRPLIDLRNLALAVGHGDLNAKAAVHSNDEIGDLATALNQMTSELQTSMTSISRLNEEVNERKSAQEKSQKALEVLDTILSKMPFGVMIIGKDRKIRKINPAAESIMGLSNGDALNKLCHQYVCPAEENACPILDLHQTVDSAERAVLTADGRAIPVIKTVLPITLDSEEVLLESFVDISARKEMEDLLREAKEELELINEQLSRERDRAEAANMAKSIFLSNISHELRTPMNGLIGMSDIMAQTKLDPKQARYIEQIKSSAVALSAVLNDILNFSKIESGRVELEASDIDIHHCLEDWSDSWSSQAGRKGLGLYLSISPDVPRCVVGDSQHLQQLLHHIVNNAIKFTRQGQIAITISADAVDNGSVTLRFSIKDTGIGIPEDRQEVMFNAFSQGDGSSTRQYGGTGLGLTIAQHLCELMGGSIECQSKPGDGSTFSFNLPFGRSNAPGTSPLFADCDGTVCILSDDNLEAKLLVDTINRWGLNCVCCHLPTDVNSQIDDTRPSVVLVAKDFCGEVLKERASKQRPTIVCIQDTASADRPCKADHVLPRPVKFKQLRALLTKVIGAQPHTDSATSGDHGPAAL